VVLKVTNTRTTYSTSGIFHFGRVWWSCKPKSWTPPCVWNISLWEGVVVLTASTRSINSTRRIFHFGRVWWSWKAVHGLTARPREYFTLGGCGGPERQCTDRSSNRGNISLWEGVVVLKGCSRTVCLTEGIFHFGRVWWSCKAVHGPSAQPGEYFTLGGCGGPGRLSSTTATVPVYISQRKVATVWMSKWTGVWNS